MDTLGTHHQRGPAGTKVPEVPEANDLASVVPQLRPSWLVIDDG